MKKIGLISDTHGLLRPEAIALLRDCDMIVHAGDIGKPDVLESLKALAPVVAVRGNMDYAEWAESLPDWELLDVDGIGIYVIHNIDAMDLEPIAAKVRVVVSGHSHNPSIEERGGVLYLNPGSAGARRFSLPVTVAILDIDDQGICDAHIETVG